MLCVEARPPGAEDAVANGYVILGGYVTNTYDV